MLFLSLISRFKWIVLAAVLASTLIGEYFFVRDIFKTQCKADIQTISMGYMDAYNHSLEEVRKTESNLSTVKDELEKINVESRQEIDDLNAFYADYVDEHGLYDNWKLEDTREISLSENPESTGINGPICESTQLSKKTSRFLIQLTKEADEMRVDYETCLKWSRAVQKATN